jgi:hypothetical protein
MTADLERLYDATDNLINQQFYLGGQDLIIGRNAEVSVKIRNSGQIIQKFKNLFNNNLNLFLEGKYLQFLSLFKKIKGLNDDEIEGINKELQEKLTYLDDTDFDYVVLYTLVLSSLISRIRDMHFNLSLEEINKRVKRKASMTNAVIQNILDDLFMKNNNNISILYNISYLDALAESFNYKKVAHTCKIQKGKFINRIVKIILSNNS